MTQDESSLECEIFIAAAPRTVFAFLIDPKLMAQWIGLSHELEPRPGGIFQVEVSRHNVARGIFLEITPYRRVVFSWGWDSPDPTLAMLPPGGSLVEIELESKGGGTLLRLRHSRLPEALSPIHRERWSVYLDRLADIAPQQGTKNPAPTGI